VLGASGTPTPATAEPEAGVAPAGAGETPLVVTPEPLLVAGATPDTAVEAAPVSGAAVEPDGASLIDGAAAVAIAVAGCVSEGTITTGAVVAPGTTTGLTTTGEVTIDGVTKIGNTELTVALVWVFTNVHETLSTPVIAIVTMPVPTFVETFAAEPQPMLVNVKPGTAISATEKLPVPRPAKDWVAPFARLKFVNPVPLAVKLAKRLGSVPTEAPTNVFVIEIAPDVPAALVDVAVVVVVALLVGVSVVVAVAVGVSVDVAVAVAVPVVVAVAVGVSVVVAVAVGVSVDVAVAVGVSVDVAVAVAVLVLVVVALAVAVAVVVPVLVAVTVEPMTVPVDVAVGVQRLSSWLVVSDEWMLFPRPRSQRSGSGCSPPVLGLSACVSLSPTSPPSPPIMSASSATIASSPLRRLVLTVKRSVKCILPLPNEKSPVS